MNKNLRKFTFLLMLVLVVGLIVPNSSVLAERAIEIRANGEVIDADPGMGSPYIDSSRTFVPIRLVSESLGLEVKWNQDEFKVDIGDGAIILEIDSNIALVNGNEVKIDEDESIVARLNLDEGRTYLPLRFVSEEMGFLVGYKMTDDKHIIDIYDPDIAMGQMENYLLPVGMTEEDVLETFGDPIKTDIDWGDVSEDWVDLVIGIAYLNPYQDFFPSLFGIMLTSENEEEIYELDPDIEENYVNIEIIDEKYQPFNKKFEIMVDDGSWNPMPNMTYSVPLNQNERSPIISHFIFFNNNGQYINPMRVRGKEDMLYPMIGDSVRHRMTVKQGEEVHIYEFDIRYGFLMNDKLLEDFEDPEVRDLMKFMFDSLDLYTDDPEQDLIILNPYNWEVIQ